ncbi:MAG: endonuclease/exonuclease/phosphatase family protein [candidate division KSB1 bacterium]|nr:endonuclease/exonuclease/phosphatase family protein [candidate division KSB1 bacterium]MDZ7345894.1 endonuclease/exonuclease/phosphatase family protein [candidate division KSB1 bacterium]
MKPLLFCLMLYPCLFLRGDESPVIRVMTFNIRYGTAPDGEHRWELRRPLVFELLEDRAPHILGLQEALDFQIDELTAHFPQYRALGVGRDDGKRKGEHSAVLYDRHRFEAEESGTFWFSDTPEVPGSKSWGNEIPRICTWAKLRDRRCGAVLFVFNLHLDHQSQNSREKSVELLLKKINEYAGDEPVIVLGDFNAGEENPAIERLLNARSPEDAVPWFRNAFRLCHPHEKMVGTFHGFSDQAGEEMIDHIFVSKSFSVKTAEIVRDHPPGRYASDHYPVTAELELSDCSHKPEGEKR